MGKHRAKVLAAAGLAAVMASGGLSGSGRATSDRTRTISFYHIHTHETLTVTYKKDGKFIPEAMQKIDWIMRDWRKNQVVKIDPDTIDLLWEMHTELGSREPMQIICGYRSRDTNEMLRRTVGGQASQSQHITGKAIDVTFPDVPLKRVRYSALVRERGGVGYYPTSGIPFVHVDTSSVRHWPRLPRYELALLFPNGRTKYQPADGGPITMDDVRVARSRHPELAQQVAMFLDEHAKPHAPVAIAQTQPPGMVQPIPGEPKPQVVAAAAPPKPAPAAPPRIQTAALTPPPASSPRLVAEPRMVERSSRLTPGPSDADRKKLSSLFTLASLETPAAPPPPKLVAAPVPAKRPQAAAASIGANPLQAALGELRAQAAKPAAAPQPERRVAALDPAETGGALSGNGVTMTDAGWGNGWVQAPAFDEEHPEELSYRPFPVAPMMTETASPDDPALAKLTHPDVARALELIDDGGAIQPMALRPGRQVAQLMWAQQFQGQNVSFDTLPREGTASSPLASRKVATSGQ